MVYIRTTVGIDLIKSLVNFVFKIFDGYITGSLGPAGSQIRKIKILNNFFYVSRRAQKFVTARKNTEPIALIKSGVVTLVFVFYSGIAMFVPSP